MKTIATFILCLAFTNSLWADNSMDDKYFDIQSVEHFAFDKETNQPVLLSVTKKFNQGPSRYVRRPVTADISVEDIINVGEWLWQIVKENKPTVDFEQKKATGIPEDAGHPRHMENWEAPTSLTYLMIFKNGFGSEVVRFKYKVIFSPKGSYNGKGRYLANTSIHPAEIDVSWGFDFDAAVEIEDLLNLATKDDPIAGIQIAMKWKVESWTKTIEGQDIYFVQGDGDYKEL